LMIHDILSRSLRLASLLGLIGEKGIKVELGTDFLRYRRLRLGQSKRPLYPMFDIASSYVDESNGFWMVGFDRTGSLVHTQAMRIIPFGHGNLGEHLQVHALKYVTPGLIANPEGSLFFAQRSLATVLGSKVCYHGDFWLTGGRGGFRGTGLTNLLSRLMMELVVLRFDPDFVFGFVEAAHAVDGTPLRHCYFHGEPGIWRGPDGSAFSEECLVWMSAADLKALTLQPVEALASVIDNNARKASRKQNVMEA